MSKRKQLSPNTVLIAIMNDTKDFGLLTRELWYRIPVEKAPKILKNNQLKYIAFYHTSRFKKEKFTIQWYGKVNRAHIVTRPQLFPNEHANHPKKNRRYYKIELEKLLPISPSIQSLRHRRILFIPTSEEKFFNTIQLANPEINYLFNDSPLENILFQQLLDNNINTERQYYVSTKDSNYILDFAIFCKTRNINIECDGDRWHNEPTQVKYDKKRNNSLEIEGWSVLRYTTDDLVNEMENTMLEIKKNINQFGGIQCVSEPNQYSYISPDKQLRLFD